MIDLASLHATTCENLELFALAAYALSWLSLAGGLLAIIDIERIWRKREKRLADLPFGVDLLRRAG